MLTFLPALQEQNLDELQFLWGRRRSALRSPAYSTRALAMLEERIAGHADGLLALGDDLLTFVGAALDGEEELPAFAAASALLRLGTPAARRRVLDVFASAAGPRLDGVRDALAHAPMASVQPLLPQLTALMTAAPARVTAVAAAEVLVFHGAAAPDRAYVERFVRDADPALRARGLRLAAYTGSALPADVYETGFRDDDAAVKRAALAAAAWNAYPGLVAYCRSLAVAPTPEAIEPLTLLAAVSPPEEYQTIGAVAAAAEAGPGRYGVAGAFGLPHYIEWLTAEMSNPDPASAAAAGRSFTKMTGRDVESNTRVKVSPDGKPPADDFEAEFMDEVFLPDPDLARKHWQELAPRLARSPRICRGMDVSQPLSREQVAALDRESLWEYCLRARLFSGWQGTPLVLERYPQRF
jgi:uncharacterized protein (TIGR02270 family)